jgi:hypothetical protein
VLKLAIKMGRIREHIHIATHKDIRISWERGPEEEMFTERSEG